MAETNVTNVTDVTAGRNNNIMSRTFSYTLNNWTETDLENIKYLEGQCKEARCQEERGEESGTIHLQGYFWFKNPKRWETLRNQLPGAHIEIAKNIFALRNYCKKQETATGGLVREINPEREKKSFIILKKDPMEGLEPYPWKQEVLDIISGEPDSRTVHWYWEGTGNIGKTTLIKWLLYNNYKVLTCGGRAADAKYLIYKYIDQHKSAPDVFIFSFTRSRENFISYEAIEEIKDGLFVNTKYECEMVAYDPGHVFCFANFPPQEESLSLDRWHIVNIRGESSPLDPF